MPRCGLGVTTVKSSGPNPHSPNPHSPDPHIKRTQHKFGTGGVTGVMPSAYVDRVTALDPAMHDMALEITVSQHVLSR